MWFSVTISALETPPPDSSEKNSTKVPTHTSRSTQIKRNNIIGIWVTFPPEPTLACNYSIYRASITSTEISY
jgi:hypothetical protein